LKSLSSTDFLALSLSSNEVCAAVATARIVLEDELTTRFFGSDPDQRPSESRLVQLYNVMCKQRPVEEVLAPALVPTARGYYLKWLRRADTIINACAQPAVVRTSPKKHKTSHVKLLFRSASGLANNDAGEAGDRVAQEVDA
jgi:hypothetical protein